MTYATGVRLVRIRLGFLNALHVLPSLAYLQLAAETQPRLNTTWYCYSVLRVCGGYTDKRSFWCYVSSPITGVAACSRHKQEAISGYKARSTMSSTDLVVPETTTSSSTQLWPEALDTPGIVPRHMKRSGAAVLPILEVLQRILYRLRPAVTGDFEKALALIGLYQAIRPIGAYLKDMFIWTFTVEITISESDAVSRDVLTWMGAEVISQGGRSRSAMLVTGGAENVSNQFGHPMRFPVPGLAGQGGDEEVLCLPPIGTRLFW